MASVREELFQRLTALEAIEGLVGTGEDLHLECKTWSTNENDAQKGVAKALCGLANADGGVLIVGLGAKSADKYTPDLIDSLAPVNDARLVASRIHSLIPELVEPALTDVRLVPIFRDDGLSGYVVIEVPPTDGPPCRSRKDWRFYQRINSGTYLMEYFQIEAMFGKRRKPVLSLFLEEGRVIKKHPSADSSERQIIFGLKNTGRAIAKFPCVRLKRISDAPMNSFGIDGDGKFGLPRLPTESGVIAFAGGADYVIYPGDAVKIAKLEQSSRPAQYGDDKGAKIYFAPFSLTAEIFADGVPGITDTKTLLAKAL